MLPVGADGLIDLSRSTAALAEGPALVAVQQVNNETGVIQPIGEIAARVRAAGSLLLADCAQGAGKIRVPDADFIAVSAHKLGGPPGMGALLVRDIATLEPERRAGEGLSPRHREPAGRRRFRRGACGREPSPTRCPGWPSFAPSSKTAIVGGGGIVIAARRASASRPSAAMRCPASSSASQLVQFDLAGIAVSAGSACSSGSMKPSRVLAAMGVPADIAGSVIRVSFGPHTSADDVDRFLAGVASHRGTSRRRAPHDLPRLSGDDAGRARGGGGDAAVGRGEFRQPALAVALGPRGGGGDRGRARPGGSARSGCQAARFAFTGSATEAINWALKGTIERASGRNRIVTIATEHAAVLDSCEWLEGAGLRGRAAAGRRRTGWSTLGDVEAALDDRVAIVAAMLVNNEIGVIQPVAEIAGAGARGRRADAVRRGPGARAGADPRRSGPGRGVGAQDPRPQGRSARCGCETGAEPAPFAPRRRAGAGPALGDAVAGAVRRLWRRPRGWRSSGASGRSHVDNCGRPRLPTLGPRLDHQRQRRPALSRQPQPPPRAASTRRG